jgi:hypothetical protein
MALRRGYLGKSLRERYPGHGTSRGKKQRKRRMRAAARVLRAKSWWKFTHNDVTEEIRGLRGKRRRRKSHRRGTTGKKETRPQRTIRR